MRPNDSALFLCWLVLFAAATIAPAQAPTPGKPTKLTLSPMAAPSPALKYQLLPELKDQTPGNAALEYFRAFSPEWWGQIRQPQMVKQINDALETPLKDLPRKDLEWLEVNQMLRQVDNAARREFVDWGGAERLRRQGFALLLPDVQGMRQILRLLAVRARLEIAGGQYDKAIHTLQTGLAMARHTGDGVILIQELVGIAIARVMLARLEELIRQPNAPNFYWALTDLPRPFFDLRKALQGEKMSLYATIPELRDLETKRLSPEQQQKLLPFLAGWTDEVAVFGRVPRWDKRLEAAFLALHFYPKAKQALIAEGRKREEIEALPVLQVVLIHSWHQHQRLQDDLFKWHGLPYRIALPRVKAVEQRVLQARNRLEDWPFIEVLPAIEKVFTAVARTDRRIAILRCIEAVRLYAAAHEGKLPTALDAITEVPIPNDPMTGKAFLYQLTGQRAKLSTLPPPGEEATPHNTLHYELTIRR